MTTEAIVTVLEDLRENVMHIRKDVDLLKGIFLEDAFLTSKERKHLDETLRLLKENKKSDFVKLI